MNLAPRTIAGTTLFAGVVLVWTFGALRDAPVSSAAAPVAGGVEPARAVIAPTPLFPHGLAAGRVERFLETGWLSGTDVDGSWGVWQGGVLQPSLTLRRRFDYLLASVGDVSVADLRQWVSAHASVDLGAEGAAAVVAIWDAYVGLRQAGADAAIDLDDPSSWQRSLSERNARRRAALGPAWAYAFFSADDQQLIAQLQRRSEIKAGTTEPLDPQMALISTPDQPLNAEQSIERHARRVSVFGQDAAERMRGEDEAYAEFRDRLSAARVRAEEIANDPQLSAQQREQQQSADLAQHFSGSELARAKALLSVSSTGG